MRIWWEILQFELRQQFKSPFVLMVAAVFALVHFLTITSTGINLWAHPQANINSAYAIAVTETTLSVFGMLPVIVFVAKAILRDHDDVIAPLLFVKPISKHQYFWGRFTAVCLLVAVVGLCGLAGTTIGTLMPWLDQDRVAAFAVEPFLFCYVAIVLPTLLIQTALFFGVASLTRSLAAAVALAMVFVVSALALANVVLSRTSGPGAKLLALADHSAALVVATATRYLTVVELNATLPHSMFLESRLLWFAIAGVVLLIAYRRFEFTVLAGRNSSRSVPIGRSKQDSPLLSSATTRRVATQGWPTSASVLWQFTSQLSMDLRFVLRSPLFLLILALAVFSTISEHGADAGRIMNLPQYPLTSTMLGFFRFGLLQFVLLIAIYYSGTLIHRERESGITEMVGSTPISDWILPVAKLIALSSVVALLLVAALLTSIALQLAAGYTNLELGLYLRAVFLHNGFYFWMLCVLAIVVQVLVSNKWLGMLLLLVAYVALMSLRALGFEHVLYSFLIPYAVYSDMNGFAQVGQQVNSLIAYWTCFCGLLLVGTHLLYPRGMNPSLKERVREAAVRFTRRTAKVSALFAIGFIALGSWIFYNTNILNAYRTSLNLKQAQVDYETKYGRYESQPAPSFVSIDMKLDLFPKERRLESQGMAILRNNKQVAISEFAVTVDPRMRLDELEVDSAAQKIADVEQGFYLFGLDRPLLPGDSVALKWKMGRANRGFVNSEHDIEVVENGTFIMTLDAMPVPGFNESRKLEDNSLRRRFGLPPLHLPELGDPKSLDKLGLGVDGPTEFRVVMSTSDDQTAVAAGELKREWRENGRRYFEYVAERPILPVLPFLSGRYQVARDHWQDTQLEVYYDPRHSYNVAAMFTTLKRSLDYYTREFSPYPFKQFRIVEYPRYRTAVKAIPGGAAYSESAGFILNLETNGNLDYATVHELAHMWWGGQAYGARMLGRQMLNETLAQYSTFMVFKKYGEEQDDLSLVHRIIAQSQRGYLASRSKDGSLELPLMRTDDQDYISYGKGPLVLFALQELIGEERVNQALRNYLAKFANKPPPFPTSRDLVNELRAVAGAAHQEIITDLFEKIVLYDVGLTNATVKPVNGGYEVSLTVAGKQMEANGEGEEHEVPMHTWFDVTLFANTKQPFESQKPLYLKKHLLVSGINAITVNVSEKPAYASVDPYEKMADRQRDNNGQTVGVK